MATSRYINDDRLSLGEQLGTYRALRNLREAIRQKGLPIVRTLIATGSDRLDTLAGDIYGDARYWWILAATSGIGWGLQVPPGTVINVVKLQDVERLVN